MQTWEDIFSTWAAPPPETEQARCDNAVRAIRKAIASSDKLNRRSLTVFVQGSYRNRVNVRQDSDVDIGVLCDESFFFTYPPGANDTSFGNGPATYTYDQFKNELVEALQQHFGYTAVQRGNKAIDVHENSYRVDADVAPFFEYRYYIEDGRYLCGVALLPDDRSGRVQNYPEILLDSWPKVPQHYENGVSKNEATSKRFKSIVRILKCLRNQMDSEGVPEAGPIPGFLIECLVWNVPDPSFDEETWEARVRSVLQTIRTATNADEDCRQWHEVDGLKLLFGPNQKWTRQQAHAFAQAAWDYLNL